MERLFDKALDDIEKNGVATFDDSDVAIELAPHVIGELRRVMKESAGLNGFVFEAYARDCGASIFKGRKL